MDTSQELNASSSSPQKGKGIDADIKNWRAGWWDIYPLLERPKRPLVWSQTSVIFAAHATQPMITGRHFSSSKQFVLPSPTPIISSPASYEPPSIITVSPGDTYLLAYFPRRDGEGTACLWKRGPQIDNWQVKECWNYPKGSGIVAASWLGPHREWVISTSGPTRLPVRGPSIPVADMTLLLVTQDNYVHATYYRQYTHGLKTIRRSLQFQGFSRDLGPSMDYGEIPSHTRQCVDAAIGLGYNESTVFIATHSRRTPSPSATASTNQTYNNMGLPVGEDSLNFVAPEQRTNEWENWGDERAIEVFELHVRFDGANLALVASQIANLECPALSLSSLAFVGTVPPRPSAPPPEAAMSPQPKQNLTEKGKLGLVTAFINFHDYTKPPTSTLTFYGMHSRPQPGGRNPLWAVVQASTRIIDSGVITHIEPFTDLIGPMVYACVLNMSGTYNAGKSKPQEAPIGIIQVLNLPSFSNNNNWVPSEIKVSLDKLGSDLPLYGTISPNRRLFCALTSSMSQSSITIHALPSPVATESTNPRLAMAFAAAILSRISTADIINSLCSPEFSVPEVADVIYQTLNILDNFNNSNLPSPYTADIMGIATEAYRLKAASTKIDSEIEISKSRWKAAHDICSLTAINRAFEDCQEKNGYDLDVVWQLIALSTWVTEFTEKIMKSCILASNAIVDSKEQAQSDSDLLTLPILLSISHPFTLRNFLAALRHVKTLRVFLGSLPAGSENAQMAQTVLLDTVDCSGVDFGGLTFLLQEHLEVVQKMEPEDCRKALATCHPTKLMRPHISQLLQKISQSETLLNKSALFIKPHDLIDGIARLSIASHRKNDEKDIITKCPLPKQVPKDICLRCGGKSAIDRNLTPRNHTHSKWHLFELTWQLRCICGGQWSYTSMI